MVCWFDKVFLNSINFDCRNKENPEVNKFTKVSGMYVLIIVSIIIT